MTLNENPFCWHRRVTLHDFYPADLSVARFVRRGGVLTAEAIEKVSEGLIKRWQLTTR